MGKAKNADAEVKEGVAPGSVAEVCYATHATNGGKQMGVASGPRMALAARKAMGSARPSSGAVALKLHGTRGRMFDRRPDGLWLDTETGAVGTRAELEQAWLDSGAAEGR